MSTLLTKPVTRKVLIPGKGTFHVTISPFNEKGDNDQVMRVRELGAREFHEVPLSRIIKAVIDFDKFQNGRL